MKNNSVKINFTIDIMLFIIFLMLKLDGIINWKWIWVFSPLWIVWILEICIWILWLIKDTCSKYKSISPIPSGPRLVWDAKTNTMYGPFSKNE